LVTPFKLRTSSASILPSAALMRSTPLCGPPRSSASSLSGSHARPRPPLPATKAFGAARSRYEQMRADPQRAGRHACKRIFALALMIHDGRPLGELTGFLASRPWLVGHAAAVFGTDATSIVADLPAEMRLTGAIQDRDGRLVCQTPHHRPLPGRRGNPGLSVSLAQFPWHLREEPPCCRPGGRAVRSARALPAWLSQQLSWAPPLWLSSMRTGALQLASFADQSCGIGSGPRPAGR
jgi:hypothetical protein